MEAQLALIPTPTPPRPVATTPPLPTAQTLVASAVDHAREHGIQVHRRAIGILCRAAKELLEDGFNSTTVFAACVTAIRRGTPHHVVFIAGDLTAAEAGQWMSRKDYERKLQDEAELRRP